MVIYFNKKIYSDVVMSLLDYIVYDNENIIFKNKNVRGSYISWPTFNEEKIK